MLPSIKFDWAAVTAPLCVLLWVEAVQGILMSHSEKQAVRAIEVMRELFARAGLHDVRELVEILDIVRCAELIERIEHHNVLRPRKELIERVSFAKVLLASFFGIRTDVEEGDGTSLEVRALLFDAPMHAEFVLEPGQPTYTYQNYSIFLLSTSRMDGHPLCR